MGDEAAATPAPVKTTTSGAQGLIHGNAWLTAAAVAAYSTRALWLKMRKLLAAKTKSKDEADDDELELEEQPMPPGLIQTVDVCPM
ncbi:uncharacterized protein LOC132791602 [Drosophila nasuta]|uniref:Uncharacterized protein LOC127565619 n=1 Tax=Drosophila albomicans TaxID=7291 RepID=A0A9C6T731_DROAB|nr:uncharacterized protein LOC127565619 [Drosophila albomicans]XP_060656586.1 uncharacterized protein LOC132791602 [Drosophila nasuta]